MKNNHQSAVLLTLFILISLSFSDSLYTSQTLGYTVYLPDNWVVISQNDSQDIFYDTTGVYQSHISLVRYTIDPLEFPTAEEWTWAFFFAYKLFAENSYDPWGVVLYSDSAADRVIDSLWAPELFTDYYSLDTTYGTFSEYQRFAAAGSYGYSIYAIGDTLDMRTNIGTYGGIIGTMELETSTSTSISSDELSINLNLQSSTDRFIYDLKGRRVAPNTPDAVKMLPAGVFVLPLEKRLFQIR